MVREHKAENQKVMALAKELHKHERTDMAHAHPKSQKSAPLPSMRK
jgi:hypothetical protein